MPGPYAKAGIGQAIANIGDVLKGKEREEEERKRRQEEQRRRDAALGLRLAEMGGGMGPAPMREDELGSPVPSPSPSDFQPPKGPLSGQEPTGPGLRAEPADVFGEREPLEAERFTLKREDPDYRTLGEGLAHVMTPEARQRREREREEEQYDRLGRKLAGLDHISDEEAPLLARGVSPDVVRGPEEEGPPPIRVAGRTFPDTPEGRDAAAAWRDRLYGSGGDTGRNVRAPTVGQALSFLQESYGQWDDAGQFQGYALDPGEMQDLAYRMSRGEDVDLPPQPEVVPSKEPAPPPTMSKKPGIGGFLARALPFGDPGYELSRGEGSGDTRSTAAEREERRRRTEGSVVGGRDTTRSRGRTGGPDTTRTGSRTEERRPLVPSGRTETSMSEEGPDRSPTREQRPTRSEIHMQDRGGEVPPRDSVPPSGERPADRGGRPAPATNDEAIQQIRESLEGIPREQWEEILREEGATEDQIDQVLGEGGG